MTTLAAIAAAGCLALGAGTDEIAVRDLLPAFAEAEGLPLETVVGLAPAPGVPRRFELAELRRIALRLRLPEPQREVCVERPVARIEPERLLEAMRAQLPDARIELVEYSRYPAPDGELEFPRSGLRPSPSGAIWNGWVHYGGRHRLAVWARVKVTMTAPRVVASIDLPAGRPIDAAALTVSAREEMPVAELFPATIDEVAGRIPRRPIRAGTPLRSAWLEEAKAVTRGETVQVEVHAGSAVLQLEGQAQASGSVGQTILVLNTMSNKRFPARVEAKGKVSAGVAK